MAFSTLATYAVQAPARLPLEATNLLVANAVHFVIHLAQDGDRRYVASVREVVDAEGPMVVSNELFRPGPPDRPCQAPRYETTSSTSSPRLGSTRACSTGPRAVGDVSALAAMCGAWGRPRSGAGVADEARGLGKVPTPGAEFEPSTEEGK